MLRQKSFSVATTTVFASLLVASLCQVANANPIIGELFYTRFAGTEQVKKVDFAYDGATSFTLGTKTTLATGIGADGITGNPNDPNSLFIDGQGGSLHRVSRDGPSTNGAGTNGVISSTSVPNAAFHLEVPNSTTLYSSGIPRLGVQQHRDQSRWLVGYDDQRFHRWRRCSPDPDHYDAPRRLLYDRIAGRAGQSRQYFDCRRQFDDHTFEYRNLIGAWRRVRSVDRYISNFRR
jgi:hypothetical protein